MGITVWSPDAGSSLVARIRDARSTLDVATSTLAWRTQPPTAAAATLPYSGAAVQAALQQAQAAHDTLLTTGAQLDAYAWTTETVGGWYAWAESATQEAIERTAGGVAYLLGVATAPIVRAAAGAAAGLALLEALNPDLYHSLLQVLPSMSGRGGFMEPIVNDPAFVALAELAADSMDEYVAGAVGLPPTVLATLDARSDAANAGTLVGLLALGANAVRVAGALPRGGPLPGGVLGGTPVATQADADDVEAQAPVTSTEEAFQVIETSESDVVIQQHVLPDGSSHWQVFVQGTEDWALDSGETGLDLGGALQNTMNQPGGDLTGSAAAVEEAMLAAGIEEGDAVDLFGYSQGGQAVANVAASGHFSVQQVTTYGAPVGSVVMPEGVEHLAIETTGDITTAAGGTPSEGGSTVVQVEVPDEVIDELLEDPGFVHEHSGVVYAWAAQQVDESGDPLLTGFTDDLTSDLAGAEIGETTEWEIER